jgi:hypothetical protein
MNITTGIKTSSHNNSEEDDKLNITENGRIIIGRSINKEVVFLDDLLWY